MGAQLLNMTFQLSGIILCMMGILQILVGPKIKGDALEYFLRFFVFHLIYNVSNILGQVFRGVPGPGPRAFLYAVNFLEFATPIALIYAMSLYLLDLTDPEGKRTLFIRIQQVLSAIHLGLLLYSQFTGFLYYIDEQNVYQRNTWFALSCAVPLTMMFMDMYVLIVDRKKLSRRKKIAFWIYLLVPLVAMAVQLMVYGISVIVFSTVVAALTMYLVLRLDETERYYAQQRENDSLKINILLSQIQPHFIYNSLTVIQQLCMTDAQAAGNAIGSFTQYLRHNMDSITVDTPIPFEEELKHVRCYVELQQLRFGDRLHVDYDLACKDFCLPTLTLQPIVENAVHYGVRKTANGEGTVRITSREFPDRYEVAVRDDGPGFVPESLAGDKKNSKVGLRNVRDRLERICHGELRIETRLGKGTTVTLVVPKNQSR